ncbi:hypothetical protein C1J01_00535 [Nonomuraea aridisoli]|uniref:DUF3592 domain-containing protein n=2 Tax=Nonomuraea aridisoli TaxID=2070368 RepID=A0A2W2GAC0_9ACTN|nr:hypothetical protein C1J01_00535 [Nonomuraea aridisoli]
MIMAGGLLLVLLGVWQAGPALAAARGAGTQGTFTAVRADCFEHHPGKHLCTWLGDFRSDDGKVVRKGLTLYDSEQDSLTAGRTVYAFDTGRPDHVYGAGGSREWVTVVILFVLGAVLMARPLLFRRRSRETARQPVASGDARGPGHARSA